MAHALDLQPKTDVLKFGIPPVEGYNLEVAQSVPVRAGYVRMSHKKHLICTRNIMYQQCEE